MSAGNKVRVYELAKELGVDTKTLIERVQGETSIEVKDHLTALSTEQVEQVRQMLTVPREGDVDRKRMGTVIRRRVRQTPDRATREEPRVEPVAAEPPPPEPAEVLELPVAPVVAEPMAPPPEEPAPPVAAPVAAPIADGAPGETPPAEAEAAPPEPPAAVEPAPSVPEPPQAPPAPEPPAPVTAVTSEPPAEPAGPAAIAPEAIEPPSEPPPPIERAEEREPMPIAAEAAPLEPPTSVEPAERIEESGIRDLEEAIGRRRPGPLYAHAEVTARAPQAEPRAKVLDRIEIRPERPPAPRAPRPAPRPMGGGGPGGPGGPGGGGGFRGPAEPAPAPGPSGPAPGKEVGRRRGGKRVYDRQREESKENRFFDTGTGARPGRKRRKVAKKPSMTPLTVPKAAKRVVKMGEAITVGELAQSLSVKASEIIRKLMLDMGMMVTITQPLDFDTATLVASEYDFTVESIAFEEEQYIREEEERDEDVVTRAPVVTIMGHVDHGKTSLLDAIQHSRIAERESGGITQHIGAYQVELDGRPLTFIDTPGHEAFTAMRARGAQVTDMVILVVAADDGVMPQTIEAINHAREADVPIVVAVNKIDKSNAEPTRVRQALTEYGLVSEEWGGDTIFVDVSAKTHDGIDKLLEMLLIQAEVLELTANPTKRARGIVIEAQLDPRRGPVATLLVQEGTLRPGDIVVTGSVWGRVRWMTNERGVTVTSAGPSTPVEVAGLSDVPAASDVFNAVEDEKQARTVAEHRGEKARQARLVKQAGARPNLVDFFDQMQKGERKELKIILKADVQGSIEAIRNALERLSNDEVEVRIIHAAAGGISESDVHLASASDAIIIGFNVRPELNAKNLADQEAIDVKLYSVIYDAVEDVKAALTGMLAPTLKEVVLGHAQVRELFQVPKAGTVAGVMVVDGRVARGSQVRLVRDHVVVWTGRMSSLKRFKEDAKEVKEGYECGIGLENFNDIKHGDVIESFEIQETPGVL
jgi:translation initiation factor IF-2